MRVIPHRRRREGKTSYKKRLTLLRSRRLRLVVRLSEKNVLAQLIDYSPEGDKVILSSSSKELAGLGWKAATSNLPSAYLVGALLAKKAIKAGKKDAILDLGGRAPIARSRTYAVLKGAVDAGLQVPHDKKILPEDDRVLGSHIESYAKTLKKENDTRFKRQFSAYLKNGVDPTTLVSHVNQLKEKVLKQ